MSLSLIDYSVIVRRSQETWSSFFFVPMRELWMRKLTACVCVCVCYSRSTACLAELSSETNWRGSTSLRLFALVSLRHKQHCTACMKRRSSGRGGGEKRSMALGHSHARADNADSLCGLSKQAPAPPCRRRRVLHIWNANSTWALGRTWNLFSSSISSLGRPRLSRAPSGCQTSRLQVSK